MIKKIRLFFTFILMFGVAGCAKNEPTVEIPTITEDNTVCILATGGTIAGSGEEGKETGYKPGSISIDDLIKAVPGIDKVAHLQGIQVCNVNSDDMNSLVWWELAYTINKLAEDPKVSGFVVTHGTDTMEETAYYLNLTVKTDKPVVLTGSMRPATSISADGPMNLYQSVCVAASKDALNKGVMVVFSDMIYSARSVTKTSTFDVMAINGGSFGPIGVIRDNQPYFYQQTVKKHTVNSEFKISNEKTELPWVGIVYFAVDMDANVLDYYFQTSSCRGLVIAGAGAGEYSLSFKEKLMYNMQYHNKPVVISSRIGEGIITQNAVLIPDTVAANDLSPQKAVILLRLALASGNSELVSKESLIRIYGEY